MLHAKIDLDDIELAKTYITNSSFSDDYKKLYLRLLNITAKAINGISVEEKIQKMTESIQLLAITQGLYVSKINDRIEDAIKYAIDNKCTDCKAMEHAIKIDEQEIQNKVLENYLKKYNIQNINIGDKTQNAQDLSWLDVLKTVLTKPYAYVLFCIALFSPYSVEIVRIICQFFDK